MDSYSPVTGYRIIYRKSQVVIFCVIVVTIFIGLMCFWGWMLSIFTSTCCDLSDVTLADEDTNSTIAVDAKFVTNRAVQSPFGVLGNT